MARKESTPTASNTSTRSKKISKAVKKQLEMMNRALNSPSDQVYHDDSSTSVQQPPAVESSQTPTKKSPSTKTQPQIDAQSSYYESRSSTVGQRLKVKTPAPDILFSSFYPRVREIDFRVYLDSVASSRVSSVMLITRQGQIMFADKMANQLYEGSLNNFDNIKIQDLFLQIMKDSFLEQLQDIQSFDLPSTFNWIVYSKNMKRRYGNVPFTNQQSQFLENPSKSGMDKINTQDKEDIFFRFLKCLCVRVRPFRFEFEQREGIKGYWNQKLLSSQQVFDCFMVETKLSPIKPDLDVETLLQDKRLMKFIRSTIEKSKEKGSAKKKVVQAREQEWANFVDEPMEVVQSVFVSKSEGVDFFSNFSIEEE